MKIGKKTLETAAELVKDLLLLSEEKLEEVSLNLGDDEESLTVKVTIKFSPGERKPVKAEASISFPVERFKERLEVEVDEIQMSLFVDNSEGATEIPPAELGDPMGVVE